MTSPDLMSRKREETLREFVRVARGLDEPGVEEAFLARLGRLAEERRAGLAATTEWAAA